MTETPLILTIDGTKARIGADMARNALKGVKDEAKGAVNATDAVSGAFGRLVNIAKGVGTALAVRELIRYSDTAQQLAGRLRIVTGSQAEFNQKQKELFDLAQRTRQPLEGVTDLYVRMGLAARNNAGLQGRLNDVVEAFGKGLAITGESANSARGAIVQFSQAMGNNFKSGGQELQSLKEQAPRVAQALADGLNEIGVASNATTGSLMQLAKDGVLTTETAARALTAQLDNLQDDFSKMPVTIGQAFTQLNNSFLSLIGLSDGAKVGANAIAVGIKALADNLSIAANAVTFLGVAVALKMLPSVWASVAAFTAAKIELVQLAMNSRMVVAANLGVGSSATAATAAYAGLRSMLLTIPLMLVAYGITKLIMGTNEAQEAQQRYNGAMADFRAELDKGRGKNGQFTADVIANSKERIRAMMDELSALSNLIDGYATADEKAGTILGSLAVAGQEVMGRLGVGTAPSDAMKKADALRDTIKEMQELLNKPSGGKHGSGGVVSGAEELNKELEKTPDLVKDIKDQADPVAEIFKNMAEGIKGKFTETFESLFSGQLDSWKDFATSIKSIFVRMLAEMATLAIAKPIIIPMVEAVGGIMGMSAPQIGAVTGQLGGGLGGAGGQGLGGILSSGSSLFSGGMTGASTFINNIGHSVFGTAAPLPWSGAGSGTLTSTLGSTFSGAWGGSIASMIGLGSGKIIQDSVASLAGAAIGNLILPGIGGILGSFAGTALSGLFGGKKKPNPASVFGAYGFEQSGALQLQQYGSKHMDTSVAEGIFGTLSDYMKNLTSVTGIDYSTLNKGGGNLALTGGYDRGTGFVSIGHYKEVGSQTFSFNKDNAESIDYAFAQLGLALTQSAATTQQTLQDYQKEALGRIETKIVDEKGNEVARKAQAIVDDITLVTTYGRLFDLMFPKPDEISAVQKQMNELNARFDSMRERATALGLPLSVLDEQLAKIKERIASDYNAGLAGQLTGMIAPMQAALIEEQKRYEGQLKDAAAAGANLDLVYKIHAINVQRIRQQYDGVNSEMQQTAQHAQQLSTQYANIAGNLGDAIYNLKVGNLSTLSPQMQLDEARSRFTDIANKAKLGDASALGELPSIANQFLEISKSYNASTEAYAQDFGMVQTELMAARDVANRQAALQQQIADNTLAQVEELQKGFGQIAQYERYSAAARGMTGDYSGAFSTASASNPNQILIKNAAQIKKSGLWEAANALMSVYTFGVPAGEGRRTAFFEMFPELAKDMRSAAHEMGIPGFYLGGSTPVNSPFVVGERGAEVMTAKNPAMVIPIQNNAEIMLGVQEMAAHTAASVKVLQAGFAEVIEQNKRMTVALKQYSQEQRRVIKGKVAQ